MLSVNGPLNVALYGTNVPAPVMVLPAISETEPPPPPPPPPPLFAPSMSEAPADTETDVQFRDNVLDGERVRVVPELIRTPKL